MDKSKTATKDEEFVIPKGTIMKIEGCPLELKDDVRIDAGVVGRNYWAIVIFPFGPS